MNTKKPAKTSSPPKNPAKTRTPAKAVKTGAPAKPRVRATPKALPLKPAPAVTGYAGLVDAVKNGTIKDQLTQIQLILAQAVDDNPPPRDLAALTRRFQDITEELEKHQPQPALEKTDAPTSKPFRLEAI